MGTRHHFVTENGAKLPTAEDSITGSIGVRGFYWLTVKRIVQNCRWLETPVIDLSRYVFEALRNDEEFTLYRGQSKNDASQVLVLSPAVQRSTPKILKRLEHEYFLKEELDSTWAARPIAIARYRDRTVLLLED